MEQIEDLSENKDFKLKQKMSLILFDKLNPEMITKVKIKEIDNITTLATITKIENEEREHLNVSENSFLTDFINYNLVLRTSLDGWRAIQGEKILTSNIEDESKNLNTDNRLNRIIKGQ